MVIRVDGVISGEVGQVVAQMLMVKAMRTIFMLLKQEEKGQGIRWHYHKYGSFIPIDFFIFICLGSTLSYVSIYFSP